MIIASGPSLSDEQLAHVHEKRSTCHVIVVNNTAERAPWADVVYMGDFTCLRHYLPRLKPQTSGEWVTQCKAGAERWKLTHVKPCSNKGMTLERIHMNGNSGAQAINLAAAFGATRILLLGFDMKADKHGRDHWFGQHPKPLVQTQLYPDWLHKFEFIAKDAKALGLEVINCTPDSALTLFPMQPITEVL